MTIRAEKRTCPVCHRTYNWNPDVGQFKCPYCNGIETTKTKILKKIIKKKTYEELNLKF